MHTGVFRESYFLPLHLLTRDQHSFSNVFCLARQCDQWIVIYIVLLSPILSTSGDAGTVTSKIAIISLTIASYAGWNTEKKKDWMRIEVLVVRRFNSPICWESKQFPENWSWYSSLDRICKQWEFQQIPELWILVVNVHAKCHKTKAPNDCFL